MTIDIHISGEDAVDIRAQLSKLLIGHSGLAGLNSTDFNKEIYGDDITLAESQPEMTVEQARGYTAAEHTAPVGAKPTRKRRTKVEIPKTPEEIAAIGDRVAAISTGEIRVGPEDTAEVQQQDAADEAAETAAAKVDDPKLTLDDVRNALGAYMKVYGMPAAQEDGPKLFALIFKGGTVPAKISSIPEDQETLKKVLGGISEMMTVNPYKRTAVAA